MAYSIRHDRCLNRYEVMRNDEVMHFFYTYEEAIDLLELLRTLHPTV